MEDFNTIQAIDFADSQPNYWQCDVITNLFDCTDSKILLCWTNEDNQQYYEAEILTDELGKDAKDYEIESFILSNWSKFYFEPIFD
jgi:hypothetical protein